MTVRIVVAQGEPISKALRRLKKKLEWSGWAWEARRRGHATDQTQERRAKRFQKRFKARQATLLAQRAGEQPVASLKEATTRFWKRTGKA
jgi:ribosomal protein S21